MFTLSRGDIENLLGTYGYVFIAAVVAVEGMGISLPGEVTLVIAAILAGKGHDPTSRASSLRRRSAP
jgi:membrane protein DedA with SNARE-associated domain